MSYDRSTVEAVIQHYFDAVYEGDADKLGAIFHPPPTCVRWKRANSRVLKHARLAGLFPQARRPPKAKANRARISSSPSTAPTRSTAFIKVRCQLPPRYFTDYLVAMKLADGWQIVSKSYRYDLRE